MLAEKRLDSGDLNIIIDTLKEYFEREMPLEKRLIWDHEDHCPEEKVRQLMSPDVGMHLIFIPEEYGGMGGSAYDIYRLSEEFAKLDLGVATAMLAVSLGMDPIRVGATEEQKKKWMTAIAEKGTIVAYGVTEPEAGSNVEALKTKADRIEGPDGAVKAYKLNGVKQFISNGGIADLYTILARTPDGPSFFVVERNTPGFGVGKMEDKHGIRLSNTSQVILEDVEVPASNLVGEVEGQGIKQSNEVFGFTRLMVAAFGLGGGEAALDRAVAYSKERKQFGTYLCEKQGYMNKLIVPHAVRLEAARAYIEEVADALMEPGVDLQVEGSIAKLFATESGNAAAEAGIQALGGYGYCKEYEVEKIKRDVRILPIYEGTSEIQQNIIGLYRMRTNVKKKGAYYNGIADEMDAMEKEGASVGSNSVAIAARTLSRGSILVFRNKLSRQQHVLFGIADCAVEVETAAAMCRRANKQDGDFLKAAARLWAAQASSDCVHRMLRLFCEADVLKKEDFDELLKISHGTGLLDAHRGRLADMDTISRHLSAD